LAQFRAPGFPPAMITKQHSARLDNARFLSLVDYVTWVHNRALQDQNPTEPRQHPPCAPDASDELVLQHIVVKRMIRYSCM